MERERRNKSPIAILVVLASGADAIRARANSVSEVTSPALKLAAESRQQASIPMKELMEAYADSMSWIAREASRLARLADETASKHK